MTVAEKVADHLADLWIRHVFGIIGAGNVRLFDAITRLGYTQIVCTHHEQAAVMAATAYQRIKGQTTCALVTTGGGSVNALTGVMSAYMDSIPVVILAGNEASNRMNDNLRAYGVQGYDSIAVAERMTKVAHRVTASTFRAGVLEDAFLTAEGGRPGPVWLEIPMDVQGEQV